MHASVADKPQKEPKKKVPVKNSQARLVNWFHLAKRPVGIALCAFLLSFAECFTIPSPFSVAFICVMASMGESLLFPLIGSLMALLMRFIWGIDLDIGQLIGCILLVAGQALLFKKKYRVLCAATAIALVPRIILAAIWQPPVGALMAAASLMMGSVSVPAFYQLIALFKENKSTLGLDDKLCCLLALALLLCGAGYMRLFNVNIGLFCASMITAALAYLTGTSTAVIAGVMCGAALALSGHGSQQIIHLTVAGLIAGLGHSQERRWQTAALFTLGAALATLFSGTIQPLSVILTCALGSFSILLIDARTMHRLKALIFQVQPQEKKVENTYAGEMLRQWESAIEKMAENLPTPPIQDEATTWQALRQQLCLGCGEYNLCWEDEQSQIRQDMLEHLMLSGQEHPQALEQMITSLRGCGCIRIHQMAPSVNKLMVQQLERQAQICRAGYERDMIYTHLTAMAQAVRRLSTAAQGESLSDMKGAMEVTKVLKEANFPARLLYARRINGHLQAALEAETLAFTRWQPQRLISDLWNLGGLSMEVTQLDRNRMQIEETPTYYLKTGYATMACGQDACQQGGLESANGDAVMTLRFPGGKHLLALSDGMGHGTAAQQESQQTLELLRLCMTAGYTRAQAITAVNGMMLSATGGDRFATVDLWTIDLWNGIAQVEKLGACQSYLWRGNRLRSVEGAALPLGILEQVAPQSRQIRLYDGDLLFIMSDGVTDAFADEQSLVAAISRCIYQDPQRTADALLRLSLVNAGGIPRDDMTVLTARLNEWAAQVPAATSDAC